MWSVILCGLAWTPYVRRLPARLLLQRGLSEASLATRTGTAQGGLRHPPGSDLKAVYTAHGKEDIIDWCMHGTLDMQNVETLVRHLTTLYRGSTLDL